MKYDMTWPLRDHRGNVITETRNADGIEVTEPITLGLALELACVHGGHPNASGETKYAEYKLARKVSDGKVIDLTDEEVTQLKELSGRAYNAIGAGAIWSLLDNPLPVFSL